MEQLFIPQGYHSVLDVWQTEQAIKFIKETFQSALASELKLRRITAPLFVKSGKGLNDNLSGTESPVSWEGKAIEHGKLEIVQSLAKWKRFALWRHNIAPGLGIYTDMNAIRADEGLDNLHSIYVDQWDWEKVIKPEERTQETLYKCVRGIYSALKNTEFLVSERFPEIAISLPEEIFFISSEDLRCMYPEDTPKERENKIARQYGAVFIQGIGAPLGDGKIHDMRSPDYDDWSLNGDIIIYNEVLDCAFEISSMGIRVDPATLKSQLEAAGATDREELMFHKMLLSGQLPQTMGGGSGQSRLCMLLLKKCHIGEVQASVWADSTLEECMKRGVFIM